MRNKGGKKGVEGRGRRGREGSKTGRGEDEATWVYAGERRNDDDGEGDDDTRRSNS